jgi:hypothetical protein
VAEAIDNLTRFTPLIPSIALANFSINTAAPCHAMAGLMKALNAFTWALTLGVLVSGCESTGLSPRESHNHYPAAITGLYRYHHHDGPAPRVMRLPLRLAVAQLGEVAPPDSLVKMLEAEPTVIASVFPVPIPGSSASRDGWGRRHEKPDLSELEANLRGAINLARDLKAEYLFVFGGAIDSYTKANALVVFDLTLIGGCIVPSHTVYSEGKISGVLVDTMSERATFIVSTDYRKRGGAPTLLAEGALQDQTVEVRDELVTRLGREFLGKLRQFQTAAANTDR